MICGIHQIQIRQDVPMNLTRNIPDSKVHGANMGPTWVLSAPDGPHVGPMNLAIRDVFGDYTLKLLSLLSEANELTLTPSTPTYNAFVCTPARSQ